MSVIPLSEFSGVRGSGHARLYIKASESGTWKVSGNAGVLLRERISIPGVCFRNP